MITDFRRYEFKYILSLAQAEALRAELTQHMDTDRYSGLAGYWINSLYYDSPDLEFFWAKIDGLRFRRKLRLRRYESADPQQPLPETTHPIAVEIKQRVEQIVEKRRVFLTAQHAAQLCQGVAVATGDLQGQAVANEILHLVQDKQLTPTCWVRYHRHALVGKAENPDLRITFDTELSSGINQLDPEQALPDMAYFLPPDRCILEVKVTNTMPLWVQSILQRHQCQLQRISKYCTSIAQQKNIAVLELDLPPAC